MSAGVKNFAVIQLPVSHLERSVRWYRDVLGLPFSFEYQPEHTEAWMNVGGVGLGLIQSPQVPNLDFLDAKGVPQTIFQLQVEDIHRAYDALKSQGVEVSDMRFLPGGGHSFTFRDPDGHLGGLWGGWPKQE
ncbi:VOC family protein [Tumebacillus flagellatus]|uniref:Glyoxalase n=1 Tax=Tumebacillus flagellatus TaxID=1157490 RepID=A0A074LLU7_9BACL|nr:VOC family protein [Tumebacillus flagellatus]KEO81525.1 glyoxalase [Tumebacillus flagellatus]